MDPDNLLERPTFSITGTDNEFHHAVCNREVLVKSSHVNSMHWKLDFCFIPEQNSNLHNKWMGWDFYIPCDSSWANVQGGFLQSQLHPSSQFSVAQVNLLNRMQFSAFLLSREKMVMKRRAKKQPDWRRSNTLYRNTVCQSAIGLLLTERGWDIKHHWDICQGTYLIKSLCCRCS